MRNKLFIFFTSMTLIACQKDDDNNNNTTTGATHSCGAKDVHNPNLTYGTVKDIDGNTYKTIQIGSQTWMAENLKTTKYLNGVSIPNITNNTQWDNNITGAWCYYLNNPLNDCPYGKIYNWYAVVNSNKLCPSGWHVPSDEEWAILRNYLGGKQVAGGKLKSAGIQYWDSPNQEASNSSGFSGLPGGSGTPDRFDEIGSLCQWWSSSDTLIANFPSLASFHYLYYLDGFFEPAYDSDKSGGSYVRCIKD